MMEKKVRMMVDIRISDANDWTTGAIREMTVKVDARALGTLNVGNPVNILAHEALEELLAKMAERDAEAEAEAADADDDATDEQPPF